MSRRKLVWTEDDGYEILAFEDEWELTRDAGSSTALEIAQFCDTVAVGDNYHDFNGVHTQLALLLIRISGEAVAQQVMLEIAENGGALYAYQEGEDDDE